MLQSLLVLVKSCRDTGPVCKCVENAVETAQETAQLITGRFDFDGTGVNRHKATGENTAATHREIRADEAEGTNFDRDLAGAVQRIGDLDQRAQPIPRPVESVDVD